MSKEPGIKHTLVQLTQGAVAVSTAVTAFALLVHFGGVKKLFDYTGVRMLAEIAWGFGYMMVMIVTIGAFFQALSVYTPIPLIVEVDDE